MKILNHKSPKVDWMFAYNEGKRSKGQCDLIGGNVYSPDKKGFIAQFHAIANQRQTRNLKNRYVHLKVSLSPQDRAISSLTFSQLAKQVLTGLGYTQNPFVIYRHYDTDHPHIHIVLSRITWEGKLISDSFDGLRARRLERELEQAFELVEHRTRLLTPEGIRLPGMYEKKRMKEAQEMHRYQKRKAGSDLVSETGETSLRNYVQMAHLEAIQGNPTGEVYLRRLERRGVKLYRHEFSRKGATFCGLSYTLDPAAIRGNYQSKELDGELAGYPVTPTTAPHPYFDAVPYSHQLTASGQVQLCLYQTRPTDQELKAVSFRAGNLGPMFMHDQLLQHVDFSPELLQFITVDRNKSRSDRYKRPSLIAQESPIVSELLLAAERRSPSRIQEKAAGFSLLQIEDWNQLASPADISFLRIQQASLAAPAVVEPSALEEILAEYNERQQRLYQRETPVNAATLEAFKCMATQDWIGLEKLLDDAMAGTNTTHAPDPELFQLSAMSMEFMAKFQNVYEGWMMDSQEEDRTLEPHELVIQQRDHFTELLEKALAARDTDTYRYILQKELADLSRIPRLLLDRVTDKELLIRINQQVRGFDSDARNNTPISQPPVTSQPGTPGPVSHSTEEDQKLGQQRT